MVASMVFGFPPDRELAEREYYRGYSYRDITKRAPTAATTDGKPDTLAQQMKVETAVAEAFQAQYFRRFPGISDWHAWVAQRTPNTGLPDYALRHPAQLLEPPLGRRHPPRSHCLRTPTLRRRPHERRHLQSVGTLRR